MFQTLKELKIFFSFKEKTKTYMSRFLTVAGLLLTPETCPSCVRFVAPTSSHPNFSHEYFLALLSKNEASPKALQLKNPVPDLPPPKGLLLQSCGLEQSFADAESLGAGPEILAFLTNSQVWQGC